MGRGHYRCRARPSSRLRSASPLVRQNSQRHRDRAPGPRSFIVLAGILFFSIDFKILAALCKESGLVAPGVINTFVSLLLIAVCNFLVERQPATTYNTTMPKTILTRYFIIPHLFKSNSSGMTKSTVTSQRLLQLLCGLQQSSFHL